MPLTVPTTVNKPVRVTQIETGIEAKKNKEAQNESEKAWKIVFAVCAILAVIDFMIIYGIYSGRIRIEKQHGDNEYKGIHQP